MKRAFVLICAAFAAAVVVAVVVGASPAPAAFPGANGKLAFSSKRDGNLEVYVMNTDGSGQTNVTDNPASDSEPAWSRTGGSSPSQATATATATCT